MKDYQDYVSLMIEATTSLESAIDKQLLFDRTQTEELKRLYKENSNLKKKYKILSEQVQNCINELNSIKKIYEKN